MALFFTWLADGAIIQGTTGVVYNKPSVAWVQQVLFGGGNFRLVSTGNNGLRTPAGGDIGQAVMAYGFGRSDGVFGTARRTKALGQENLALTYQGINLVKGVWFGDNTPDTVSNKDNNPTQGRQRIRNAAGVFTYLNYVPAGTAEPVWNKWMRVSNWIDLVCFVFDQQYPWGTMQGEPVSSAGQASLRALYAYWIDRHLAGIEAKMTSWTAAAQSDFVKYYPPASQADTNWVTNAFGPGGFVTAGQMRFPRPGGAGNSPYGAYGNAQMTKDGGGTIVNNIGQPAVI